MGALLLNQSTTNSLSEIGEIGGKTPLKSVSNTPEF